MFPHEMTDRKQWITWHLDGDKKIPHGKSNAPETWSTFEAVRHSDKIGFVFSADDPFVGIDLDGCIDEAGKYNETAIDCLSLFAGVSYCEISQSGRGLHFIVKGKKSDWSVCKRNSVECYEKERFWIMTGDKAAGYDEPKECQDKLDVFLAKYLAKQVAQKKIEIRQLATQCNLLERMQCYVSSIPETSQGSRNSDLFRLAGHLAAFVGTNGNHPTFEQMRDCLVDWNLRCNPPLEMQEFETTIRNAMVKGTPREPKLPGEIAIDLSDAIEGGEIAERLWPTVKSELADEEDDSDVDFCLAMVPETGLLRQVYDHYWDLSMRPSPIMGLAVAISVMEVLLGRKVATHTDLRSNDYNLIIAQTASGKEACKSAITKLFDAAGASDLLLPADVQSGNGLITAIKHQPCCIWIGDEFGKVLQGILDKKGSQHLKNIGKHLLSLYGESSGRFLGAAHAAGSKNDIDQPHLVVLGLTTGSTLFVDNIKEQHVSDGLMNRISIWPVQHRPKRKRNYVTPKINQELVSLVSKWFSYVPATEWNPAGNLAEFNPTAVQMGITPEAQQRWEDHSFAIDEKMETESSQRSAMWGRTAARSLMLAMVHRCARLSEPIQVQTASLETEDVNWGIKLSNWLSRIACDLVEQNMHDAALNLAKQVLESLNGNGPIMARDALRQCRSLTAGDLDAAAVKLGFEVIEIPTRTKPKKAYLKKRPG